MSDKAPTTAQLIAHYSHLLEHVANAASIVRATCDSDDPVKSDPSTIKAVETAVLTVSELISTLARQEIGTLSNASRGLQ